MFIQPVEFLKKKPMEFVKSNSTSRKTLEFVISNSTLLWNLRLSYFLMENKRKTKQKLVDV